jgi:kynurenine formamidase
LTGDAGDGFPDLADFRAVGERLRNWGRWGEEDERGTLNFITPQRLVDAAKLVRTGKVFDLGIPLDENGPQPPGGFRANPLRLMSETGVDQSFPPDPVQYADDYVFMALQAASQWDALGHVFYDGYLYNGFPDTDVTPHGLKHDSIDKIAKDVIGRGVLLDIPALKDVSWLEGGYVITPEDLDAACARQRTEIRSGDILLLRTGWRRFYLETGSREDFMATEPGLGTACCRWLHEHEIAAVASDNWGVEVHPGELAPRYQMTLHMILLRDMGVTLGEMLDFEELAADCADDGVFECLLAAPVLKFTRGAGTPINPLAVK